MTEQLYRHDARSQRRSVGGVTNPKCLKHDERSIAKRFPFCEIVGSATSRGKRLTRGSSFEPADVSFNSMLETGLHEVKTADVTFVAVVRQSSCPGRNNRVNESFLHSPGRKTLTVASPPNRP